MAQQLNHVLTKKTNIMTHLFAKKSFWLLSAAFVLLSLVSCSQDDEFYQETEQISEYKVVGGPEQAILGYFYEDKEGQFRCDYTKEGNCLPEVVIIGKRIELMRTFESYVEKGAEGVSDYFTGEYWKDLFPMLEQHPEKLSALCSGDYYVHRIGDNGNGAFYIATPNENPSDWSGNILVFRLQIVK